ncbi:MAG: PmoA family protein [Caulobacter sp.]|nr:PmoA family protein [Caulobacter sp.]
MKALFIAALIALAPAAALARPGVDASIGPDGVTITDSDTPVLFYRTKAADPSGEPGRLNYVHPLYAPDGTILTEDGPADHPHQRGAFWSWHQVRLGGAQVADGWFMKGLTFFVKKTNFDGEIGGAGVLTLEVDWIVSSQPELVYVAREMSKVRIRPLKDGARRIEFDTVITPLVDGLALGGSDDAKGYGGFSLRLIAPDRLVFGSRGKAVTPAVTPVSAGPAMGFSWPGQPGLSNWTVGLACKVNGKPVTQWILRRELSMQNCVWPGRAPVALPKDKPLRLQSTLVIQPTRAR